VTNPTTSHRVTDWEVATGLCIRSLLPDEGRVCKACGKQRSFLHDEHCNAAGPNATIRHNHVKISLIRGLETLPGAQFSKERTIGVSSRRNNIRWESQNCSRLTGGADYGGAVTDFDVTVVFPHSVKARQIFATVSRTHSDLPPEELVKNQLCTVMDRKHQDNVARLRPQGDTLATFHPLGFTTGGSIETRHGTPYKGGRRVSLRAPSTS